MGEDREESSSPDGGSDATGKQCEHCGKPIATNDWYPVSTERDEEGSLRLYAFCSEDCQSAWLEDRSE